MILLRINVIKHQHIFLIYEYMYINLTKNIDLKAYILLHICLFPCINGVGGWVILLEHATESAL